MKLLLDSQRKPVPASGVWALGTFDGVHRGHRHLIDFARDRGAQKQVPSGVLTFPNHPQHVLRPQTPLPLLTTPAEKVLQIGRLHPDLLMLRTFTPGFADTSCEDFAETLYAHLRPSLVVIGPNYSFGVGGQGDARLLRTLLLRKGVSTRILPPLCEQGAPISSTRVRQAVQKGELEKARRLLGRAYSLEGQVAPGKRMGRQLGFPTANLPFPAGKVIPPFGVYVAWVRVFGGDYPAVLNIGRHPTLPEGPPTIEVFLLDASMNLYGCRMRVELLAFLRPEQVFEGPGDLGAQIAKDVQQAKQYFGI